MKLRRSIVNVLFCSFNLDQFTNNIHSAIKTLKILLKLSFFVCFIVFLRSNKFTDRDDEIVFNRVSYDLITKLNLFVMLQRIYEHFKN